MWLLHAILWVVTGCLFYSIGLSLVMFTLLAFMDMLVIVHLCYTHQGWTREASAAYKEQSVWGEPARSKRVRSCIVSAVRCTHCDSFSESLQLEACAMWSIKCNDRPTLLHWAG